MVSFEIFVKAMPPSLSALKVLPSFAFKIPDDVTVAIRYIEGASKTLNVMKLFCDVVQHSCSMPSLTKLITIVV